MRHLLVHILVAYLLASIVQTQLPPPDPTPLPIAYLDYSRMQGTWYGIWEYPNVFAEFNATCWLNQIVVNNTNITWSFSFSYNDTNTSLSDSYFVANKGGSVWNATNSQLIWIAVDPVGYNWGVATDGYNLYSLAKSPYINKNIILAQLQLAKGEGFGMETNLTLYYNNTDCPTSSFMKGFLAK